MTSERTAAEVLKQLGMTGILTLLPEEGGVVHLLCDMDVCYCPRGRGHFQSISRDSEGRLVHWMPTKEHWPKSQADGGRSVKGNVWLAHRLCNKLAYGVGTGYDRKRQQALDRTIGWSDTDPRGYLSGYGNHEAAEAWWKQHSSRKAAHPNHQDATSTPEYPTSD